MNIKVLGLILSFIILAGCGNYTNEVIDADDNGQGKSIRLVVKPSDKNGLMIRDDNGNIASKWVDTGLVVNNFVENNQSLKIGLSIRGRWYPWGSSTDKKECSIITCADTRDIRCNQLPLNTPVVDNKDDNIGCYLGKGKGIYILVAKADGQAPDPNLNPTVANSPSAVSGFYTAHLGDFQADKNGLVSIDKFWSCDDDSSVISCNPVPISKLVGGKVYLKVYDGYYGDNSADMKDSNGDPYILINIKTGVLYPNFVSAAIKTIVSTINDVSERVQRSLIQSLKDIAYVIVLMYFAFTAFGFVIGMIKINQTEAVVRLMKLGIVFMILTPGNIITEGFSKMYQELANLSSNIVMQSLRGGSVLVESQDNNASDLENSLNYLQMYDEIVNQILSRQVHLKLLALLFTWNFWLIPMMYILIVMIIFIVLRSLLLYISAYVQIAFLILILPILVPTMLFQTTADIFQNWLKYMANSALLIVVATTGFGIVLGMMLSNFGSLLNYSVIKTWWWFPEDNNAVSSTLNFTTYVTALIKALICYAFVEVAPKLADALSESQLSPSLNAFNSLWNGMSQMMNEGISNLKNFNNQYLMGRLMDQSYKTDGKYDRAKEGQGILDKWKQTRSDVSKFYERNIGRKIDRISKKINDDSIISLSDPYKDQKKKDELANLRDKNERNHTTFSDYKDMIDSKRKEYIAEVRTNGGLINEITLPDGTVIQLDANGNEYIVYDGQEISKQEIRDAIGENRPFRNADGQEIGNASHNPVPGGYDTVLNDRLQNKLQELAKIEQDYGFVKRK